MTAGTETSRRALSPVHSRARWAVSGMAVQAAGLGGVTAFVWVKLRHQGIGGHITAAMFRLAWHSEVRTVTGLAVLIVCAAVYAAGSILLARPYVSRPVTLFVTVPVAAVAGMAVLGVLALVVAALIAGLGDVFPDLDIGRRRRKARQPSQ